MSSFAGEDPVRLLKIVEMDIDALDKQRGKLESVANNGHGIQRRSHGSKR
ncbi:MAG: hypothetical protein ACOX51_07125 [Myxococcota bacterium]